MLRSRGLVAGFHERYRGVVERMPQVCQNSQRPPVTPQFGAVGLWQGVDETAVNYISAED